MRGLIALSRFTLVALVWFLSSKADAQDYYWSQPTTGTSGTFSGTASSWLTPPGVPVAGTVNSLNFYAFNGATAGAFVLTNDIGNFNITGAVTLNNWTTTTVTLAMASTNSTLAAGSLISINGPGNTVMSGTTTTTNILTLGGIVNVVGSGNGFHNITAVISGSGGLNVNLTGSGFLSLTGTNTYAGGVTLTNGILQVGNASAFGTAPVVINGGALRFSSAVTYSTSFTANNDFVVMGGTGALGATSSPTLTGVISGNGGLRIQSFSTSAGLTLQGTNTFSGSTVLDPYFPATATITNASLTLSGANGALSNTSSITIGRNTLLTVGGTTANANRLPDSAPITINTGRLTYVPVTAGTTEIAGDVVINDFASFATTASGVSTIQFGTLTRNNNAAVFLDSSSFGTINSAVTATLLKFTGLSAATTNAPAAGAETQIRIVPWMTSSSATNPAGMVTYDDTNGFTAVPNTNATYITQVAPTTITQATHGNRNIRFNGAGTYPLAGASVTINAMTTSGNAVNVTNGTLNVFSGFVLNFDDIFFGETAGNAFTLAFGGATGHIFTGDAIVFRQTSTITGTNGLVIAGKSTSTTTGVVSFQMSAGNSFSGGLWINGNAGLGFTQDNQLGLAGESINLGGGRFSYNAAANLNISRPVVLGVSGGVITSALVSTGGTASTATATTELNLSGVISGAGGLIKEGNIILQLSGNNTYSGGTMLTGGTLRVTSDANLGATSGRLILNGGTLELLAANTFVRPVEVNSSTTITNNSAVTFTGSVQATGQLFNAANPALTKSGTGTLTFSGDTSKMSTPLAINAGAVHFTGVNSSIAQATSITVAAGTNLTLSNASGHNYDRVGDGSLVAFSGAASTLSYIAPSTVTTVPAEVFGRVTNIGADSVFSITGDGTNSTELRISSFSTTASFTFRGTNLGSASGNYTRIKIDILNGTPITSNITIIPNVLWAGTPGSTPGTPAGYDMALGIVQFVPTPISGNYIDNIYTTPVTPAPSNTPPVSLSAAFTANATYDTSSNARVITGASIYSLVLDGVGLDLYSGNASQVGNGSTPDGTLAIIGGILTAQTAPVSIVTLGGNTVSFGAATANVTTTTNLTIGSGITVTGTAGLTKNGLGSLIIGGTYSFAGMTTLNNGTLDLGSTSTLAGGLTVNSGTVTAPSLGTINNGLVINGGTYVQVLSTLTGGLTLNSTGYNFTVPVGFTYSGPLVVNQGTLNISSQPSFTVNSLNGTGGTIEIDNANLIVETTSVNSFAGAITGAPFSTGGLIKRGTGSLTLSGTNSYLGGTVIDAGVLQLGANNAIPNTNVTIGTLTPANTNSQLNLGGFNVEIGSLTLIARGSGSVHAVTGTGTLKLNGDISYIDGTAATVGSQFPVTLSPTTIDLNGAVRNLTTSGQENGTNPGDMTITSIITNGGLNITINPSSVAAATASGMLLNAPSANTYALGTTVNAGTLNVGVNTTLGTGLLTINQSGTVVTAVSFNSNMTLNGLASSTIVTPASARVNIFAGSTLTIDQAVNTSFGGVIGTATGAITKAGIGTLTLTQANTYGGVTNLTSGSSAGGGIIFADSGTALSAGNLTIGNNGGHSPKMTFDNSTISINDRYRTASTVTLNKGEIELIGNSSGTTQTMGALTVTTGTTGNRITVSSNTVSSTLTFASLTTIASGTNLVFTGTNLGQSGSGNSRIFFTTIPTISGNVIPNAYYGSVGALNLATYDPTFGVVLYVGPVPVLSSIIDNIQSLGSPTPLSIAADVTSSGTLTINTGARIFGLTLDLGTGGNMVQVHSPLAGNGAGTGNDNTDLDTLNISSGNLTSLNGAKTLTATTTGTKILLNLGTVTTTSDLTLSSDINLVATTISKLGTGVFTVNGTYSVSGATTLTAGTLTLPNATTVPGGFVVSGGTLDAPLVTALPGGLTLNSGTVTTPLLNNVGTALVINGGSLSVTTTFTVTNLSGTGGALNAATNTIVLNNTANTTYSGAITAGGLIKQGGLNTFTFGTGATLTGNPNLTVISGTIDTNNQNISIGSLTLGNATNFVTNVVTGTGKVTLGGSITLNPNNLTTAMAISGNFDLGGAVRDVIGLSFSATTQHDYTFTGVISGTGGLNFVTPAQTNIALTGANTFTGTISTSATWDGELFLAANNTISTNVDLVLNSTLGFVRLNPGTTVGGVTAGNYSQSVGSIAGVGPIQLGSATLTVGANNTSTTYSGILSGTNGSLIKNGDGLMTMTGANTFTGALIINAGTTSGGGITFSGTGTSTGGALTVGNGTVNVPTLTFDNTATNNANRYSNASAVNLNNGAITLIGNSAGTAEVLGALTIAASSINNTLTVNSTTVTSSLTFSSLTAVPNSAKLIVSGTNLGVTGAGNSRLLFTTAPTLDVNGILPNVFIDTVNYFNRSTYDPVLGVKLFPFVPSGVLIDNINAPSLPTNLPLFTVTGNGTVNAGAKLAGLTLDGGTSLNITQIYAATPGLGGLGGGNDNTPADTFAITGTLTSQNGSKSITATTSGILSLSGGSVVTTSDLSIASNVTFNTTTATNKSGAGLLTLNGTANLTGLFTLTEGGLTLGATSYINANGGIAYTGGSLTSAASSIINLAAGQTLSVTNTAPGTYAGLLLGSGNLSVATGAVANIFTLSGSAIYSGTTTITSGTLRSQNALIGPGGAISINDGAFLEANGVIQRTLTYTGGTTKTGRVVAAGNLTIVNPTTPIDIQGRLDIGSNNVQLSSPGINLIRTATLANGGSLGSGTEIRIYNLTGLNTIGSTGVVSISNGATATVNGKLYAGTQFGETAVFRAASAVGAGTTFMNITGLVRGSPTYLFLNTNLVGGGQEVTGFSTGLNTTIAGTKILGSNTIINVEIPANATPSGFVTTNPIGSASIQGNYSQYKVLGIQGSANGVISVPSAANFTLENRFNNAYTEARVGDSFMIIRTSAAGLVSFVDEGDPEDPGDDFTAPYTNGTIQYGAQPPTVTWAGTPPVIVDGGHWELSATSTELRYFVAAPVPEPTAIVAMGAGLLGFGRWIRRRNAKKLA